jgi:hypothetical protein
MILKEAFRYQNYLGTLINSAISYLSYADNVTIKTQEHLRNKVNSDAENETVIIPKKIDLEFTPNQIIDFLLNVLSEKELLSMAIDDAKLKTEINMDSSISINKQKQSVAEVLSRIVSIKANEKTVRGSGYKFNLEGNQVNYAYEINEITQIDFDRNKVKSVIKKLRNESDEVSTKLDKLQVEINVVYSPIYDLQDSFEDALDIFVNKK